MQARDLLSVTCKLCNSPLRVEAEKLLLEGVTARPVARWLQESGLSITFPAVQRHKKKHMPVTEEVKAQLAVVKESRKQLDAEVEGIMATLEGLDEVFMYARAVAIVKQKAVLAEKATMVDALLLKWMLVEMREAVKAKHELTNGKKVNLATDGLLSFLGEGHSDETDS